MVYFPFSYLRETALAQEHQEKVPVVEHGVSVVPRLVLVVKPFQLADVQVPRPLQLLHLQQHLGVLFLQRVQAQSAGRKISNFKIKI